MSEGVSRDDGVSGPLVARTFEKLLALVFLGAFASLGAQVPELMGSRGLLPVAPTVERLVQQDVPFLEWPSLFRHGASDSALGWGIFFGSLFSVSALLGVRPRLSFALATFVYLSFTLAGRNFLAFQWDNLLIECGFLAAFLRKDERAKWVHLLIRLVLFKLYFQSGIAKYQSHLGDWHDGSAMTYYYETAPIPTWLGWYAHHLPDWWHHFESRATLVWEIGLPFAFFAPRKFRLIAAALVTAFQVVNIATANYGFFSYLACVLHVFLLGDRDIVRFRAFVGARLRHLRPRLIRWQFRPRTAQAQLRLLRRNIRRWRAPLNRNPELPPRFVAAWGTAVVATLFVFVVGISTVDALTRFARPRSATDESFAARLTKTVSEAEWLGDLRAHTRRFRVVNTYHLFGHITRARIEPELQVRVGGEWQPQPMHYKPGPVGRPPPFVAPHQPRVDFLLWFHGLGYRRGLPQYVRALLDRACNDPEAIQDLFVHRLPRSAEATRFVYFDYRFTTPEQKSETGDWWIRREVGTSPERRCR